MSFLRDNRTRTLICLTILLTATAVSAQQKILWQGLVKPAQINVYASTSITDRVTTTLKQGDVVDVVLEITVLGSSWCRIAYSGQSEALGDVLCLNLQQGHFTAKQGAHSEAVVKQTQLQAPVKSTTQSPFSATPDGRNTLEDGTPVKLRIAQTVSSADAQVNDRVEFEVLEDVRILDTLIISKSGIAWGTVTEAQSKRRMGRAGKLEIVMDSVRLVDGEKAALRATKEAKGGGHVGAMTAGIVATAVVFWPAAPLFLLVHGKDITIPKGTEVPTFINGNFALDMAKFQQATPGAAPQVFQASATASVSITSTPAGGEISIDQNFVGNTPSSISVSGGKHVISVRKAGFQSWEREIAVSGGSVNLTAELLPASASTVPQSVVSNVAAPPQKSSALNPQPSKQIQPSGEVETKSGWIGVTTKDDASRGLVITRVLPDSSASQAGLQDGDIVIALNGKPVKSGMAFDVAITRSTPGSQIRIAYMRGASKFEVTMTVGKFG